MEYQKLCKNIKSWGIEPVIHSVLWILFIAGEIYSLAILTDSYSSMESYIVYYVLNILLFYIYVWLLFKVPYESRLTWIWALLIFIIVLTIYIGLAGLIATHIKYRGNYSEATFHYTKKFIVSTGWRGFYFMLFATGFVLMKRNARRRLNEVGKKLEIERLKAQLVIAEKDFLLSQINPHLLFNTLSFISHSTKYHPENARIALGLLSDIMDYALDSTKGDTIDLMEEVEQIKNMITINQLRFENKLNLKFAIDLANDCLNIAPLILLTLVENIFKHGNLLDKTNATVISLKSNGNLITFNTSNPHKNKKNASETSTGLENIVLRLNNIYPGRHKFSYHTVDNIFFTELVIET